MSTEFLNRFDSYVLSVAKKELKTINMPIPTEDVLVTGITSRPLYARGDIGDSAVQEDTGNELPTPPIAPPPLAPPLAPPPPPGVRGAIHKATSTSGKTSVNFFVVGHKTSAGTDMLLSDWAGPASRVKGQKYLQKITKKGHGGTGRIY